MGPSASPYNTQQSLHLLPLTDAIRHCTTSWTAGRGSPPRREVPCRRPESCCSAGIGGSAHVATARVAPPPNGTPAARKACGQRSSGGGDGRWAAGGAGQMRRRRSARADATAAGENLYAR
nr:unnamed protein product [Digitaria exilis]